MRKEMVQDMVEELFLGLGTDLLQIDDEGKAIVTITGTSSNSAGDFVVTTNKSRIRRLCSGTDWRWSTVWKVVTNQNAIMAKFTGNDGRILGTIIPEDVTPTSILDWFDVTNTSVELGNRKLMKMNSGLNQALLDARY